MNTPALPMQPQPFSTVRVLAPDPEHPERGDILLGFMHVAIPDGWEARTEIEPPR